MDLVMLTMGRVDWLVGRPFWLLIQLWCRLTGCSVTLLARLAAWAAMVTAVMLAVTTEHYGPSLLLQGAIAVAWVLSTILLMIPRWERLSDTVQEHAILPVALIKHVRACRFNRLTGVGLIGFEWADRGWTDPVSMAWNSVFLLLAVWCYYCCSTAGKPGNSAWGRVWRQVRAHQLAPAYAQQP
jgi:hypothetical protein